MTVGLVLGFAAYLGGPWLLQVYSEDADVISYGLLRMSIICTTYFLCGMMDTMVGSIRGLGYSILPTLVSPTGACGLRVIWIFTIFAAQRSLAILYLSYPISWAISDGTYDLLLAGGKEAAEGRRSSGAGIEFETM